MVIQQSGEMATPFFTLLPQTLYEQLKEVSSMQRLSMAAIVREALKSYLTQKEVRCSQDSREF